MLFLWDVDFTDTNREIKLKFYDSSNRKLEEFSVSDYRPYFLAAHPLSEEAEEAVANIQGEVELVQKKNLFTNEMMTLSKVKAWTPMLLKKGLKYFESAWESEIRYGRSYVYDKGLIFGAPYQRKGDNFTIIDGDKRLKIRGELSEPFAQEKEESPLKYAQIKEWLSLCNYPIPEVDLDFIGGNKGQNENYEQIYLGFLLARIANIPIPEAYSSKRVSDWIKSMIYTYLRRNQILIPTSTELRLGEKTHRVPGALTLEPEAGIYFNTIVCDFESLYPSCIDKYNLSYETIDCQHRECTQNKMSDTKHHICTKRKGFYSLLIGALKDLRIRWFKPLSTKKSIPAGETRKAKAASKLLKLISVSSYGVTVRIHGVACPPLAESITACGRWVLQKTCEMAKEAGMHPTYGDTDSIFLNNPTTKQVQVLINNVKEKLKLDLTIEKQYALCVLPKAKKAYFGITKDGISDLKGLTAIKSNAPRLIQRVFQDCVKVLGHVRNMDQYLSAKREIITLVNVAIKKLRKYEVNFEDLIYSTRLYYDPNERAITTKIMPQPYQCALQLIDAGEKVNRRDIVHFVKVKPFTYKGRSFTVKPFGHVKSLSEINVEDYIRNLKTALEQTFKPMDIQLERMAKLTDWLES